MDRNVFDAMVAFGKEKVEGVLGGRHVSVHAVHDDSGGIVGVGG